METRNAGFPAERSWAAGRAATCTGRPVGSVGRGPNRLRSAMASRSGRATSASSRAASIRTSAASGISGVCRTSEISTVRGASAVGHARSGGCAESVTNGRENGWSAADSPSPASGPAARLGFGTGIGARGAARTGAATSAPAAGVRCTGDGDAVPAGLRFPGLKPWAGCPCPSGAAATAGPCSKGRRADRLGEAVGDARRITSRSIVAGGCAISGLLTQRSLASPTDLIWSPLSRKSGRGMGEGLGVRGSADRSGETIGAGVTDSTPGVGVR